MGRGRPAGLSRCPRGQRPGARRVPLTLIPLPEGEEKACGMTRCLPVLRPFRCEHLRSPTASSRRWLSLRPLPASPSAPSCSRTPSRSGLPAILCADAKIAACLLHPASGSALPSSPGSCADHAGQSRALLALADRAGAVIDQHVHSVRLPSPNPPRWCRPRARSPRASSRSPTGPMSSSSRADPGARYPRLPPAPRRQSAALYRELPGGVREPSTCPATGLLDALGFLAEPWSPASLRALFAIPAHALIGCRDIGRPVAASRYGVVVWAASSSRALAEPPQSRRPLSVLVREPNAGIAASPCARRRRKRQARCRRACGMPACPPLLSFAAVAPRDETGWANDVRRLSARASD